MNIFITGITGLIGKHICIELLKEKSIQISGQYHSSLDLDLFQKNNIRLTKADINDPTQLKDITQNIDIVVHTAARVMDFGTKEDFYNAHYFATLNLLEDCKKNNVKQFIYLSSVGVASGINRKKIIPNEQTPIYKTGILYDDVKIDTENMLKDFCTKNNINYTIIRPSAVIGPSSVWVKEPLERKIKKGFFPLIDKGKHSACLIDVRNLANGIAKTINNPNAYNQTYFFVDDFTHITWKTYFTDILSMINQQPNLSIPYKIVYPIAVVMEWIANLSNKKPMIAKKSLQAIGTNRMVSCEKAKQELNWKTIYQYHDALVYIQHWVKEQYPK